jgi:hypothetical protein
VVPTAAAGDDLIAITLIASLIDQAGRFLPELVTNARLNGHTWDQIAQLDEPQSLPPTTTMPPPKATESSRSLDVTPVLRRHSRCPVATAYFATKPPPATYMRLPGSATESTC